MMKVLKNFQVSISSSNPAMLHVDISAFLKQSHWDFRRICFVDEKWRISFKVHLKGSISFIVELNCVLKIINFFFNIVSGTDTIIFYTNVFITFLIHNAYFFWISIIDLSENGPQACFSVWSFSYFFANSPF